MDSQDYLDQISKSVRPANTGKNRLISIITSKYTLWGAGALVLLIAIIMFGSMLGKGESLSDKCISLRLKIDQTNKVIDTYQPLLKSSKLRSLSASLKGIFTNTSSDLNNYLVNTLQFNEENMKEGVAEEAELNGEALSNELFNAKINGLLDRTYAHKMALEIYSVMSAETSISNSVNDESLKEFLKTSYNSLNNLYTEFNDFSETK